MLNPITEKLRKMNLKSKLTMKQSSQTTPNRFLKTRLDSRIKSHFNKENDSLSSNSVMTGCSTPWKRNLLKQKSFVLQDSTEQKLTQYAKDNQDLMEKIKTHQMMEEFYLRQLERQKTEKKNLEWRLSVLGDELKNNFQPRNDKINKRSVNTEGQ